MIHKPQNKMALEGVGGKGGEPSLHCFLGGQKGGGLSDLRGKGDQVDSLLAPQLQCSSVIQSAKLQTKNKQSRL